MLRRNIGYHNEITSLSNLISDELSNIHDICFNLRPITLDTVGLSSALNNFVSNLQKNASFNIHLYTTKLDTSKLSSETSICVFRVIQEAVTNSIKYANPHNIYIHLFTNDNKIIGYIKDDGIGFEINDTEIHNKQHFGITMMRERCAILNGKLNIISKINKGTIVSFEVPT